MEPETAPETAPAAKPITQPPLPAKPKKLHKPRIDPPVESILKPYPAEVIADYVKRFGLNDADLKNRPVAYLLKSKIEVDAFVPKLRAGLAETKAAAASREELLTKRCDMLLNVVAKRTPKKETK